MRRRVGQQSAAHRHRSLYETRLLGYAGVKQLQRDLTWEPRVLHQEHLPQAADAELTNDALLRDLGDFHVVSVPREPSSASASWQGADRQSNCSKYTSSTVSPGASSPSRFRTIRRAATSVVHGAVHVLS